MICAKFFQSHTQNLLENPCKKASMQLQTKNESIINLHFIEEQRAGNHGCCCETALAEKRELSDEE
jgi:hypothetical protein